MKKFTLLFSMLVAFVTTAMAQTPITSPEEISSNKIYWIEFLYGADGTNNLGGIMYADEEEYKDQLWCTYVWTDANDNQILPDPNDPNQQFAFIKGGDNFYLYSVAAKKFVTWENDGAWLTDVPKYYIAVTPNTLGNESFPWNIGFDGEKFMAVYPYSGYDYSGYLYCSGNNPANALYAVQIHEVGTLENGDELSAELTVALETAAAEKAAALDSLITTWENIENYIIETGYEGEGGEALTLQTEDEAGENYIWCNEPEMSEGPISDLIDGNTSTFFHSCWNGTSQPVHWLQINNMEPISSFTINYHTRVVDGGNDFPDAIEVQGSNDGANFTTIATLDNKLPQMGNTAWESENIVAEEEYSYLRFVVTAERIYFHMSEFGIKTGYNETANDAYKPYVKYIRELVELNARANEMYNNNADLKTADIMALIEEINYLYNMIESLVSGKEDPITVEYIAEVDSKYAVSGVGYPTKEAGAAFYALLDAAKANPTTQARLDLQAALEDYLSIDNIIMPEDGKKYTLTFVTWTGVRNLLNYNAEISALVMERDTLTEQGLAYPETAVFTCKDNGDGTYSFITNDNKYVDKPAYSGIANGTEAACISESPVSFTIEKIHPNGKAPDATYEMLFSLVALNFNGTYYAPNSSGGTYYTGNLPHFQSSWTSAMKIEEYNAEQSGIESIVGENGVQAIYDLTGRRIEKISAAGIYIVNGKKVLVK